MAPQVIWMMVSYAIVASIGMVLLEHDKAAIGIAILILFPTIRIARRFRKEGGYRLIGGAGVVSGDISQRGGFASRAKQPGFFWLCFFLEILTIGGLGIHIINALFFV